MGGPISYAIFQLAKTHRATAGVFLREIGLHPGQELLLMRLRDDDRRTQAELVAELGLDASTVARVVHRLERQRLIERTPSPHNRRATIVSLTASGIARCEDVRNMWSELERVTTQGMSGNERDTFRALLESVAARLGTQPR
jgi:DNA-binding MarR family transcriptional regulator